MDVAALTARMERMPAVLEDLLEGTSAEDVRWRPPEGGWSIVEILNHLVDEEVEDFRARLRCTLEDPAREWPPLDPEGIVASRKYQERNLRETLERFRGARADSLAWLATLPAARWDTAHVHARRGAMRAGDLLASWAAHDARHLGQLAKRLHALAVRDGAPYSVAYAG